MTGEVTAEKADWDSRLAELSLCSPGPFRRDMPELTRVKRFGDMRTCSTPAWGYCFSI